MNNATKGLIIGAAAGVVDVIPMLVQKLPWAADASAFVFWVAAGFMIATSSLKLAPVVKGIVVAYVMLIPVAFVVGSSDPASLIPMSVMTLILGSLSGWVLSRWTATPALASS